MDEGKDLSQLAAANEPSGRGSSRRGTPRPGPCPVCGLWYASARPALVCWLGHEPNLGSQLTLQAIGDKLGVTRERARQLLKSPPRKPRARRPARSAEAIQHYASLAEEFDRGNPGKVYRSNLSPEQRERGRIKARERYRNDPQVREAARLRYEARWKNDATFREVHRRRARARYYRLKLERLRAEAQQE